VITGGRCWRWTVLRINLKKENSDKTMGRMLVMPEDARIKLEAGTNGRVGESRVPSCGETGS